MMQWEQGRVLEVRPGWPGVARLQVRLDRAEDAEDGAVDATADTPSQAVVPALAFTELVGTPEVGERLALNTNALRRGLGTGGQALVVARLDVMPRFPVPDGHMMKARYTPVQTMVDAIDDPASPHHATLAMADDLAGMPVVLADLHSALPAVVAGIRARRPGARIVYVMTDGAALPAAFSRSLAGLREHDLVSASITCGQAFGGDLEAVTVHSALLGAHHVLQADVTIVTQGPGNLGTSTPWGFSGLQGVETLHAVHVLGGRPINVLRVSGADARERHQGLSHHTGTELGRAALAPTSLAVPRRGGGDPAFGTRIREQLTTTVLEPASARGVDHTVHEIAAEGLVDAVRGLPLLYAAVAGAFAAEVATPTVDGA
jgi:hypothetical protein